MKRPSHSWPAIPVLAAICLASWRPCWASVEPWTPSAIRTCSNIAWQQVKAPAQRSFLRLKQVQRKRALFGVRYLRHGSPADDQKILDPNKEESYESEDSDSTIYDASTGQFDAVATDYLVWIRSAGWIFDPMTNDWSSFKLPQGPVLLYPHVLSTGQYLLLGRLGEQPTAYLVYPRERHTCRLPLDQLPFFARRKKGWQSQVEQVVDLEGKLLLWGRYDEEPNNCHHRECEERRLASDRKTNQGIIFNLPAKPK